MSDVRKGRYRPYPEKVLKIIDEFKDLTYNGVTIICKVCEIELQCWDKYDCRRHVNSKQHIGKKNGVSSKTELMFDLLLTLVACDIPLHILDKKPFREFWNKYNPQLKLPSRKTLQNYVPAVREDTINKIKCVLRNKRLWLCVDQTTDYKKNFIVNVIVRILDPRKPTFPLLLASKRLTEHTDNTIMWIVLKTLEQFELSASQVLMFVSDGTPPMCLVSSYLQERGCMLVHIRCKMYSLHLVAETVRQSFRQIDELIASTKKVFLKSAKCLHIFRSECPGIPEPPQPNPTRGGMWLKAALYYAEYFQQIKAVIQLNLIFNPEKAAAVKEIQAKFEDISVETALKTIHKNYKSLHDAIVNLQNRALSLEESLQIVDEVNRQLHAIGDGKNGLVKEKFVSVLKEDAEFSRLRQIYNGASSDPLSAFKDYFKYACITAVDVQESFSKYKHIFSPLRTLLTETTIETYLMLQSFYTSPVCDNQDSSSS